MREKFILISAYKPWFYSIAIVFLSIQFLHAQPITVKGTVINHFTNEVMPFASVKWKHAGNGVLTDSVGHFFIKKNNLHIDTLVVTYVGFEDVFHSINPKKDTGEIIIMVPQIKLSTGVIVKAKFNKGLRWWKSIVTHKKENNPYQFSSYYYELYNKLELDINNIKKESFENKKILKPFAFVLDNIDSTSEAKPFLPIFLTESLSDYYYSTNPTKIREEIKAIQTNGIKNETVMQFLGGVSQKVNIYEDYITVFGKEFISPASTVGDKYYNYKGADTQTIGGQKFYHLLFTPKQEGSNTFLGDLWIHSTTWAIQKVTLNISATANINFVHQLSIIQEFAQTNDGKWVFTKDKFVADISPLKKDKFSFIGRKTSTYRNVQINAPFIHEKLSTNKLKEEVIVLKGAKDKKFDTLRHEPLSHNENKVYAMIDTLKNMPLFQKYSNTLQFIFDGHKQLGKIEIGPWFKWLSGNQLEKVRMRFDIGTTNKFSEHLRLSGYLAYGFKDNRFKQKLAIDYKINHHESWRINATYLNDLDNGRIKYDEDDDATTDNLFSQLIRRRNIRQKFIGEEQIKLSVEKKINQTFSIKAGIKNIAYQTYSPLPSQVFLSRLANGKVINSEANIKFRYAPGEKEIERRRNKSIKIKSNLPVFDLKYTYAFPDFFRSQYQYHKLNASISQSVRIPRWGKIDYMVYGGKYFGDSIPFMLLEVHPGNEIYYYNKQSFNLMNRFEYISDAFAGLNLEYNFEKKLMNLIPFLRKTKVRQFINIKTVIGDMSNTDRAFNRLGFGSYRLKRLRGENYTEIGTGIDNLFKFFRIDLVWRIDPSYIVPPATLPAEPQKFAIFGSFKLQF
ncbi:MAG: carboxypeptidase-like regulatory domain-containing protein [Bacteroidetes bacterium]|nr:carboxypeptidase-like regulatory domain-containing protein [Bacteroidota bacterium]MBS1648267.1 carboxypeptidase-like regulatory domain-containing protein [Bacteroidota bacterium]